MCKVEPHKTKGDPWTWVSIVHIWLMTCFNGYFKSSYSQWLSDQRQAWCRVEVLWGQQIKLIHTVSNSNIDEYYWKDFSFFILHHCRNFKKDDISILLIKKVQSFQKLHSFILLKWDLVLLVIRVNDYQKTMSSHNQKHKFWIKNCVNKLDLLTPQDL